MKCVGLAVEQIFIRQVSLGFKPPQTFSFLHAAWELVVSEFNTPLLQHSSLFVLGPSAERSIRRLVGGCWSPKTFAGCTHANVSCCSVKPQPSPTDCWLVEWSPMYIITEDCQLEIQAKQYTCCCAHAKAPMHTSILLLKWTHVRRVSHCIWQLFNWLGFQSIVGQCSKITDKLNSVCVCVWVYAENEAEIKKKEKKKKKRCAGSWKSCIAEIPMIWMIWFMI